MRAGASWSLVAIKPAVGRGFRRCPANGDERGGRGGKGAASGRYWRGSGLSPAGSAPTTLHLNSGTHRPGSGGTAKHLGQRHAGGHPRHLWGNQPLPTAAASPPHSTSGSGSSKQPQYPRTSPNTQAGAGAWRARRASSWELGKKPITVASGTQGACPMGGFPGEQGRKTPLGSHHVGSITGTPGPGMEQGPWLSRCVGTSNLGQGW